MQSIQKWEKKTTAQKNHEISSIFCWHPHFWYKNPTTFPFPTPSPPASSADLPSGGSAHPTPPGSWPWLTWKMARKMAEIIHSSSWKPWKLTPFFAFFRSDSIRFWAKGPSGSGRASRYPQERSGLKCFGKRCLSVFVLYFVWFFKQVRDLSLC